MKGKEITDINEALKRVDYRMWFTDDLVNSYLPSFEKKYAKLKNESEKKDVLNEATLCVLNYSLLVYHIYENSLTFRKAIQTDPKLNGNFNMIKEWLDGTKAKSGVDEFIKKISEKGVNHDI